MICPKCGNEIANDSAFCEYCGAKIRKSSRIILWGLITAVILLSVIGLLYINSTSFEEPPVAEEEVIEEVVEEVAKPRTHVLQPGDFFTKISLEYYGTEDSVAAIIRLNNITNPDNVPVGTELLLP